MSAPLPDWTWSPTAFRTRSSAGSGATLTTREATETSSAGSGIPGMGNEGAVTDTEADEMEEHLRGLGYLE